MEGSSLVHFCLHHILTSPYIIDHLSSMSCNVCPALTRVMSSWRRREERIRRPALSACLAQRRLHLPEPSIVPRYASVRTTPSYPYALAHRPAWALSSLYRSYLEVSSRVSSPLASQDLPFSALPPPPLPSSRHATANPPLPLESASHSSSASTLP